MMSRTLLIHKASHHNHVSDDPDDVSINITVLSSEANYEAEGIGLAEALWKTLPAETTDAMLERFTQLNDEFNAEYVFLRLSETEDDE